MRLLELKLGNLLKLKKPHPCGSYEWEVVRLGLDIGIQCKGCGRRVLMVRSELERRVKSVSPTPLLRPPSSEDEVCRAHEA